MNFGKRPTEALPLSGFASVVPSDTRRNIPTLDGLRGIAILLVLLHHLTLVAPTAAVEHWMATVATIGWSGVDLFFVLSGFLITRILIDARGSSNYFSSFYARRTLRIFPLYYLVVFTTVVLLPLLPSLELALLGAAPPPERWPYWVYLTNLLVADRGLHHGILDVAWSLAIEEQFYIVWAAIVWLWPGRYLGALCATIVVAVPVLRTLAIAQGAEPVAVYVLTWYRADALAIGALLAWTGSRSWPALAPMAPWAAAAGVAGIVVVTLADGDTWWWGPWMQRAGYSCIALTSAAMLVGAITQSTDGLWGRMLSAGWLRTFGKYSYCLYLIHLPVMRGVRSFVFDPVQTPLFGSSWLAQLAFYVAAVLPALGLAWISWRFFEAPILRLKDRFPY